MDSDKDFNTYSINLADLEDTLTDSSISAPSLGYGGTDTITLSDNHIVNGGVSLTSPYTFTGTIGTGFSNTTYTTSGAQGAAPWMTQSPASPKIQLNGEGADVEVNGWSLVNAIQKIEERLNILHPNTDLETEWEELKQLGDQYRKLEQHIKDKQATWDRLRAMPKLDID